MRPRNNPNIELYEQQMDEIPVKERCLFCRWTFSGTAVEGRHAALAHRLEKHPEVKPARRRPGRHLTSFRQAKLTAEDRADIYQERDKRAYLLGIEVS